MAKLMNIPVLGVVENFSYLVCPDCGKKISIFGESHVEEAAQKMELPVLGRLPVDPAISAKADQGAFSEMLNENLNPAVELLRLMK